MENSIRYAALVIDAADIEYRKRWSRCTAGRIDTVATRNRKINYSFVVDFFIPDEVTRIRVLLTEEQGIVATVPQFNPVSSTQKLVNLGSVLFCPRRRSTWHTRRNCRLNPQISEQE